MGFFSFQENRCGLCGETFPDPETLKKHREGIHANLAWKVIGVVMFVLAVSGGVYYQFFSGPGIIRPRDVKGALKGQHWHADYTVKVCGEEKSPFLRTKGDIHTHGKGRIHIHPHSKETEGSAANLQNFIESVGGTMSDTQLIIPHWDVDSTEPCDEQPSEFVVFVNGNRAVHPTDYKPQDGDKVQFIIRPKVK
ncbi:MAG: hypothetical protein ABEJ65_00265 [bacterium]